MGLEEWSPRRSLQRGRAQTSAEIRRMRHNTPKDHRTFNGAAPKRARRCFLAVAHADDGKFLQRGRAQTSAEIRMPGKTRPAVGIPSTGPRPNERGDPRD